MSAFFMLLFIPDRAIRGSIKLGTGGYDMQSVYAPSLSGSFLDSFSIDLSSSSIGPWIRRFLLNTNQIEIIRELAAQVTLPPLYYPMVRVKDEYWEAAAEAAKRYGMVLT